VNCLLSCHGVLRCRIFELGSEDGKGVTEFGDDRVFNDLRYTINSDKLHSLGWKEVRVAGAGGGRWWMSSAAVP